MLPVLVLPLWMSIVTTVLEVVVDANGKAKDTRTEDQKEALIWLIAELKHRLNISKVQGHRDYSPDQNGNGVIESFEWIKSCPCFNAIPEYKDL